MFFVDDDMSVCSQTSAECMTDDSTYKPLTSQDADPELENLESAVSGGLGVASWVCQDAQDDEANGHAQAAHTMSVRLSRGQGLGGMPGAPVNETSCSFRRKRLDSICY